MKKIQIIIQAVVLYILLFVILGRMFNYIYYITDYYNLFYNSNILIPIILIFIITFIVFIKSIYKININYSSNKTKYLIAMYISICIIIMLIVLAKTMLSSIPIFIFISIILYILLLFVIITLLNIIKNILSQYIIIKKDIYETTIEEMKKSQDFKTELITNVSHDIKTPLTSIINYVDLIGKLEIDNNDLNKYTAVLEKKSARLKYLINDLIEASKIGTGNITITKKEISITELIGQVVGEYQDLFKTKNLELVYETSINNIIINTDGMYLYRIIDNIMNNVYKYSMTKTRVYLEVMDIHDKVSIKLKNISKQKLNITPIELCNQFKRGDDSRSTEGSGLGLYIAKSLSDALGYEFNIYINGDLFEIEIII